MVCIAMQALRSLLDVGAATVMSQVPHTPLSGASQSRLIGPLPNILLVKSAFTCLTVHSLFVRLGYRCRQPCRMTGPAHSSLCFEAQECALPPQLWFCRHM